MAAALRAVDAGSETAAVIESWIEPIRKRLDGVDLSAGVTDSEGRPMPGTRGEHLAQMLAETLMGYGDLIAHMREECDATERRQLMPVLNQAVLARRAAAVKMAIDGRVPSCESMETIELRLFEAAEAVRLGAWA